APFHLNSPFYFQSPGHHRDLHSFPTRRSSDLEQPTFQPNPRAAREQAQWPAQLRPTIFQQARPRHDLLSVEIKGRKALKGRISRSEEHTSELQSRFDLVCRLLLEKKNIEKEIT